MSIIFEEVQRQLAARAYLDLPELLGPTLSPDGNRVAFLWNETGRRELYIARCDGHSELVQLTDRDLRGQAHYSDYCWGPESRVLYLYSTPHDNHGEANIAAVTLDGKWIHLCDVGINQFPLATTPAGKVLIAGNDFRGIDSIHPEDGSRSELVDAEYAYVVNVDVSSDGEFILFSAIPDGGDGYYTGYWMSINNDDPHPIDPIDANGTVFPVGWLSSGDRAFVYEHQPKNRYGVLDPRDSTVEWIGKSPMVTPASPPESDEDSPIGMMPDDKTVIEILDGELTVVGSEEEVDMGTGTLVGADVQAGRIAAVTGQHEADAPRLVVVDWPEVTRRDLLKTAYGPVTPADNVAAEEYTYTPASTDELATVLVRRPERGPSPAVAITYFGNEPYDAFPRWDQYLVHRGYAVVRPAIPGAPFTDDEHADVAAVGEWLCDRDWVEDDRVAVFGHSSGARQVFMQLFTRGVWKAGIARCGPTNIFLQYERDDQTAWMHNPMGDPDENEAVWREQNPIDNVDGLEDPLRIHHGVNDSRVPIAQARALRTALLDADFVEHLDFEYSELPDAGHITVDIQQYDEELTQVVDFLNRYLKTDTPRKTGC